MISTNEKIVLYLDNNDKKIKINNNESNNSKIRNS